jgi:hypothetical protein
MRAPGELFAERSSVQRCTNILIKPKNMQRKQCNEITRLERKVSKEKVHISSQKIQSQKNNSATRSPVIFFENANRYCLKREKVKKKEKKDGKCSYSWRKKRRFSRD